MIPELMELLNDEESHVRMSAVEVMVGLLSFWSEHCISKSVKPLLHKVCSDVIKTGDLVMLDGIAGVLGKLCHELKGNVTCHI